MGLDQYAMSIDASIVHEECKSDFDGVNPELFDTFHTWRKHPNLQGWMEKLYRDKGGFQDVFNSGAKVKIDFNDLELLKEAVMGNTLPETAGFFFGESDPARIIEDLEFIKKAKQLIKDGKIVVYDSWW